MPEFFFSLSKFRCALVIAANYISIVCVIFNYCIDIMRKRPIVVLFFILSWLLAQIFVMKFVAVAIKRESNRN